MSDKFTRVKDSDDHQERQDLELQEKQTTDSAAMLLKQLVQARITEKIIMSKNQFEDTPATDTQLCDEDVQNYIKQIDEQLAEINKIETAHKSKESKDKPESIIEKDEDAENLLNEKPDEYYLHWEPHYFSEKVKSYSQNSFEIWYSVISLYMGHLNPSLAGILCLILCFPLLQTSTLNPQKRFKWGLIIVYIQLAIYFMLIGFRLWYVKHLENPCDEDKLRKQKKILGFIGVFYEQSPSQEAEGLFEITTHKSTEFFVIIPTLMIMAFIMNSFKKKIDKLLSKETTVWERLPTNLHPDFEKMNLVAEENSKLAQDAPERKELITTFRNNIEYYRKIIEKRQESSHQMKSGVGNKETKSRKEEMKLEEQNKLEEADYHKLKKQIPMSFVDSTHFYSFNKMFFVLSIFFLMAGAFASNSCSDLPALLLILVICAMYPFRKQISTTYRKACFFIIYWILFMIFFKAIFVNIVRIPFIAEILKEEEKQGSAFVSFVIILFGGMPRTHKNITENTDELTAEDHEQIDAQKKQKWFNILCFIFCFKWITTKWIEIRMMTADLPENSFGYKRFQSYFKEREDRDKNVSVKMSYMREKMSFVKNQKSMKKEKGAGSKALKKIKKQQDISKVDYIPERTLWLARLTMFFFSYLYHSDSSIISICWIVLSFVLSEQTVFLFSGFVMLPILLLQFVLIYGIRLPIIQDRKFFNIYGQIYKWNMASEIIEQSLMYFTLLLFFMMPSCYLITKNKRSHSQGKLIAFFEKRCLQPKFSKIWIYVFFSLRYFQSLLLMFLFIRGFSNTINNLKNLGYMIFFVFYTAYENLYRRTSFLLCLFTAFFIVMQYYESLFWQIDTEANGEVSQSVFKSLTWANIIPMDATNKSDPFDQGHELNRLEQFYKKNSSMYLEVYPSLEDWVILICMGFLQDINKMYLDKHSIAELERKVSDKFSQSNTKLVYYVKRFSKILEMILSQVTLIILACLISQIQINLINWMFYCQTTLLIALKLRASTSVKALNESLMVARSIKTYSLIVLVAFTLFIGCVGFSEKDNEQYGNLYLKAHYPIIYNNLDFIGFRSLVEFENLEQVNNHLKLTFITYVVYFFVSIYITSKQKEMMETSKRETQFKEHHYKAMFEASEQVDKKSNRNLLQEEDEDYFDSIYIQREKYTHDQLVDFYEGNRFSIPFMMYRSMNLWPIFDAIAQYGHLINNLLIVLVAVFGSVSIMMCFQICCVCSFYTMATLRLNKAAKKAQNHSGIQTQCDIKMVQMISKSFKIDSYNLFYILRHKIAKVQFIVLLTLIWLSFPTGMSQEAKQRHLDKGHLSQAEQLDNFEFWLFIIGIFKDQRPEYSHFFKNSVIIMSLGILVERFSLAWQKDRFGCTHYRLQKFIELDMRREALRKPQWEILLPKYDINRYRQHYFLNNYDQMMKRILGDRKDPQGNFYVAQREIKGKDACIGDFVPYKDAVRIRDFVTFSVKLDCGAPETRQDLNTQEMLDQKDYDYESIPILRKFKIEQLEIIISDAVDLKYKVSLAKGVQLFLEVFMITLVMLSLVLKSNMWSWFYILFVFRSVTTNNKTSLLVNMNTYIAILFVAQYFCFLLNLTSSTSPGPFPDGFKDYPKNEDPNHYSKPIPMFFRNEIFRDLQLDYSIGLGIDKDQLYILIIDFINLYTISVYILVFKNPILMKSMKKVFWQFPTPDNQEQWNRLDAQVQKYVLWLNDPIQLKKTQEEKFVKANSNYPNTSLGKNQIEHSQSQYNFAVQYNKENAYDLNYYLTTYVDMKFQDIWCDETLKQKKNELKNNSIYFRLVKQGSVLVYITFHIITIAVVMITAALRQSFMGIGYLLILLPRLKDGAEVLNQRAIAQENKIQQIIKRKDQIEELLKRDRSTEHSCELENHHDEIEGLKEELEELNKELKSFGQQRFSSVKEKALKNKQKDQMKKGWPMINAVKKHLLIFGLFDFSLQMYFQMPMFAAEICPDAEGKDSFMQTYRHIGFQKIWTINHLDSLDYNQYVTTGYNHKVGFEFQMDAFIIQCLNVVIISIIMLQSEIFDSAGYIKFITQSDGSMDLLMQLSGMKAKSITYIYNNQKIRSVVSIQRKKETIMQTVDKLKLKLIRWRKFTKTSLGDENINKGGEEQEEAPTPQLNLKYKKKTVGFQVEEHGEQSNSESSEEDNRKSNKENTIMIQELAKQRKRRQSSAGLQSRGTKSQVQFDVDVVDKNINDRAKILKPEEKEQIILQLTKEFVNEKKKKLRCGVKFYNWLNKTFTEQIIFKNKKPEITQLVQQLAAGEVYVPTELEVVMHKEAEYIIRGYYDNLEGNVELSNLFNRAKTKQSQTTLLNLTGIEKKIKLKQMRVTWNFTRTWPLIQRMVETFFHIIISQTQNLIYISMIYSMYQNAGLISIFYPIMCFGYGLVQETRPRKEFWRIIRLYTTFLLLVKFIFNLALMRFLHQSKTYVLIQGYMKIGLYDFPNLIDMLRYMSPEILIISFIMLNEIKLKLCGIYFLTENEMESIQEAIDRNLQNGDEEIIRVQQLERANMCMERLFTPIDTQIKQQTFNQSEIIREAIEEAEATQKNIKEEDLSQIINDYQVKFQNSKAKQLDYLESISKKIFQTSKQFDIDNSNNDSPFDQLVTNGVLQKSLETDNLIYVEGSRQTYQPDFVTQDQMDYELNKQEYWESYSGCDYPDEYEQKDQEKDLRLQNRPGIFEKSRFMDGLFPSLKIQKPGYDLYGLTTAVLLITVGYVFVTYKSFTVDPKSFVGGVSDIFEYEMAITLVIIIFITIIERIASRTDTKKSTKTVDSQAIEGEKSFFSEQEMFKRTSTNRSMTVSLKTMKTGDIDMQSNSAQDFLQSMYGSDDGRTVSDESRTKITVQQKLKFCLHWFMIIGGHLYIFWYIPITGNYTLYKQPNCDHDLQQYYGCKNFHNNTALMGLYFLLCLYMMLSALQLSYGFPIMRKPSSVLHYDHDVAKLAADVYYMVPFLVELRCLIDFTFHETSLDMFQTMALFSYHYEIYASRIGNMWYGPKILGSPIEPVDKCIFGWVMTSIVLILIVGPLILFSNLMPGLVTNNPVLSADISIYLNMNTTKYSNSTTNKVIDDETLEGYYNQTSEFDQWLASGQVVASNQSTPYEIYRNMNPFFRTFNERAWEQSNFSTWTETNYMDPEQAQLCQANDFSDEKWDITEDNYQHFRRNLLYTVNVPQNFTRQPFYTSNFSLNFDVEFTRAQPATALKTSIQFEKTLDYNWLPDCLTGLQIRQFTTKNPNCTEEPDAKSNILIRQAYLPNLILGQSDESYQIERKTRASDGQKHDIALTYMHCQQTWGIQGKTIATSFTDAEIEMYGQVSDVNTCANPSDMANMTTPEDRLNHHGRTDDREFESEGWGRLQFTLFSMLVSASLLATYSPATFYAGIAYVAGTQARAAFIINSFKAVLYEMTDSRALEKLFEAVYIHRHEQNLREEEETYRMIVEIFRSPELFKALTGSSLKGDTDPKFDKMDKKTKDKLLHLEKLENKGFDVEEIKMRLLESRPDDQLDDADKINNK